MKKYIIFILPAFLFIGCSVWEDFTTYFNLYYNTVDVFEQAEQQLNEQRKDPFAKFDAPVPGSVLPLLDKVIEKCSRILQFNANSRYVDDALIMIGKAFYYQKNYLKALRKFQELIATKSESDLVPEARLWEAKTYFAMNNSQKALELMEQVKSSAKENGRNKILKDAYIEEIRYYLIIEDFDKVLPMLTAFVEFNTDEELNSRVMYQAGEILAQKQDYALASKYYTSAYKDFTPTYETSFLARLKASKMLLYLDKSDVALDEFYELRDSPKFKEFQDQVELAIGITYVRMGNFDDAMALFIRFDTTYSSSQHLGNARYVLAQMYEKDLKNFDSAIIYYQKALASAGTAEYLPLIRERSSVFNKYSTALRDYFNNRKQYVYLINPERFTQDSILFAQDTATLAADAQVVEQNSLTGQSNIQERIRDFDVDLDIERKLTELAGRTTASQGAAPVRPTISLDSSKSIMARCGVELGNMFLTSLSLPDSAYFYYSEVINEFGSRAYMAKALYGLAGYYATLNDSITADSLYRNIYANYKDDKLVNEAAKKINQPLIDFEFDPAKDTYLEAEKAFNAGNDSLALKKFEYIRENHRNSRHYAQSIYASAYILETKYKKYDSAAVIYDSLVTKFPTTAYAQKVQPKLSFYKEEKARIKQAIADSLQHIQDSLNHIQDSLKADSLAKIPKDTLVSKDSSSSKLKSPAADTTAIQGTDSTAKSGMDSTNKKLSPVITPPDEQTETPPEEKQEEIVPEKQKKPEPEKPVLVPPVVNPDNGIPPGEKGLEKPPEDERLEPKPEEGGQPTQEPPKQQLHAA